MLQNNPIRKHKNIMNLEKMGSKYPSRLSFSRSMLRRMIKEKWKIKKNKFRIDKKGYGYAIYEITAKNEIYSLICFSEYLKDSERSDRVIAEKWDTSYTLHVGKIDNKSIKRLKQNIPLQESGRASSKELVLSRANKSVRLFEKVVDSLSNGIQPEINEINKVGYLLRTTAVYGSGKFGLSDFAKTKKYKIFNQPFRAEMLAVYIIREFSVDLVEHIAFHRNPKKAVKLQKEIKQHLGIGNSTGLGMAPFLIKHPKLIHQWVYQYENAIMTIRKIRYIKKEIFVKYLFLLEKSKKYLEEVLTSDKQQQNKNIRALKDLVIIINKLKKMNLNKINWSNIIDYCENKFSYDAQEIIKVQMLELYPKLVDNLAENMSISDELKIKNHLTVRNLKKMIEKYYKWAIQINYKNKNNNFLFWYTSEEKLEPRLGERYNEPGSKLEQPLGIGKMVNEIYNFLCKLNKKQLSLTIAEFLILYPKFRGIVRRIHSLSDYQYAEIKENILAKNILATNMLRFKLSFFGASRFDPKSDRWLRVSFYNGAPFYNDINTRNVDQWGFNSIKPYN
ncbi:MAG: hypothetical protein CFH19_00309 [Alphaproteobacteria bacterium MarineAlpha5_Bin9]|nr:MAG: hypothetical protein CFH19_00309 [Alphaproteobacteria bacterium MarineAlpha5_Bin9]|tara:strand:+ start:9892 stop:11574 length:1683 start_codon:yes stop_codon:yes gene_type:complete